MGKHDAVFTITRSSSTKGKRLNIKSKRYNLYNKYEVPEKDLFIVMCELAEVFNNELGIGITYEID